jgi:tetratricopeptide (TPR) repeat protein
LLKCCLALFVCVAGLRAQPHDAGCALSHAVELHQTGDLAGAIREYQACLVSDPNRIEVRSNLGAVFARLGRYQDAIDQYLLALKTAPAGRATRLRFNLALAYYKSFQISHAASELDALHAAEPHDLNIALLLADCDLRTGEFKKAIALLLPFEPQESNNDALAYVLGMALIRDGRVAEGQQRVDRILRRGESAEGHFLLGSALSMAHDYPKAIQEFSKAIAINPAVPSLQSFYGQALLATGDPDGAAEAFRKEIESNPNDYEANFQLASILAFRGKQDEARPLLERAVQVRPASVEARNALAHGFHFDLSGKTADGVATGLPAPEIRGIDFHKGGKPVVLVFGSYTCPKLRTSAVDLNRLYERYRSRVDFRLVYIREAHAGGSAEAQWQSTINQREGIELAPARNVAEKQDHAQLCVRKLKIAFPAVIDGMDSAAESAYDAWPSRVYLIGRDSRVAFNSRLGELDFRPLQLESAIAETLAKGAPHGGSR